MLPASLLFAQYAGSSACKPCHSARVEAQSLTGHAHALAKAAPGSPGEWAFGAGAKATTWVSQLDRGTYMEHGQSYFASTKSFGLTPGHDTPADVRYRTFDPEATTLKCFHCHSTGPLSVSETGAIAPYEMGVRCESCHGPGAAHVAGGKILNPRKLSAEDVNELCGVCHRSAPESDWTDKWKTRHQPPYLAQSTCFRKSNGALNCITCHDPHAPLNTSKTQYDRQCVSCHKTVQHRGIATASRLCVDCHMPQVTIGAQLKFTNHWIGIYAPAQSSLLPSRSVSRDVPPVRRGSLQPDAAGLLTLFESKASPADLGLFLLNAGDIPAAEAPLRRALEEHRTPDIAERLGEVLAQTNRVDESLLLLKEASGGNDAQAASRAFALLAAIDPAHAEEHYRGALRTATSDPKRTAILLNNLAATLKEKRDYPGSLKLFREALAIQVKTSGADSPAAASTMSNLGSLLETVGQHAEAERMERAAVAIFERRLGPSSAELATACTNLADILWSKGDRAGAAPLYRKSVSIDESVYGAKSPEVAGDLVNLGTLLKEMRQPTQAVQALSRALTIFEQSSGPQSPQAVEVRQLLAK